MLRTPMSESASESLPPLPPPTPPAGYGDPRQLLRLLPPVDQVLAQRGDADHALAGREEWVEEIRHAQAEFRARILSGAIGPVVAERAARPAALLGAARRRIERRRDPGCVRVTNATGVVLHTNLGRAHLPEVVADALAQHGRGYQLLAADHTTGQRSPRERHVEKLFQELTGADAATVVNNNAAATMIALAALARGREVIVARGQLVEIGGAYRIPEVMTQSGATLVEVGTTNRVHLRDYENAITNKTGLLMRVHTSNYRVEGFHGEVSIQDLCDLGERYGIPVVDDLGSGALVSLAEQGLPGDEPLIKESIEAGVDLITASGDKLIGGPQMGILVGTRESVARVRAHPLFRAMRCDKLGLIAMEATLRLFLNPDQLAERHPTVRMLTADLDVLEQRAEDLATRIRAQPQVAGAGLQVTVVPSNDAVGAGSLPTVVLPGWAVALRCNEVEAGPFATRLRAAPQPLFTTVKDHQVHLHLRTIHPEEEAAVLEAVACALEAGASAPGDPGAET